VTVAGSDALNASFLANVVSARLESGYRYDLGGFGATPYAAIQSQWMQLPSYSETATSGSLQFALSYPSQNLTDVRAELGAWLDKTMLLDRGSRLQLYARAAWANDSGSGAGTTALFQSLPGASFIVDGAKPDDNSALVSAGVKYAMLSGWSVMASFDGEFSGNTSIYSATGTIRKIW